ncbi:MAG: hypothetical protein L0Z55_09275, partial [Planctomycetes bacterium]|nr:hypothetical protein [Planctomycetota bacterium]
MQCPRCLSHNGRGASYCDQCGAPLEPDGSVLFGRGAGARRFRLFVAAAAAVALLIGIWSAVRGRAEPDADSARTR